MKILITGGHITPALAVADKLVQRPNIELVFVGRKHSTAGEDVSMEYKELSKRDVRFIHLTTGRLTRIASFNGFINFLKIIPGIFSSFKIILSEKPDRVLSFGGYLALPISIAAFFCGVPVYTHEQTISAGLTNKIIGFFCKKVFISFAETKVDFAEGKTIVTGNPVRESIFKVNKKIVDLEGELPVIYVTGGSLGSHSINAHIEDLLPTLLEKYQIVHQTGNVKEYNDYERLTTFVKTLPPHLHERYFATEHVMEDELGYIFKHADLIITRSGANTFFELLSLEKPAIFIPLPWSANGEQLKHAELMLRAGCGEIFHQDSPSEKLAQIIDEMMVDLEQYRKNFQQLKTLYKHDAAEEIISHLLT